MKVVADYSVCQGHGQCAILDDDIFALDDDGYVAIGDGKDVPEDRLPDVRIAVSACPVSALKLADQLSSHA